MAKKSLLKMGGNTIKWILAAFMIIGGLVYWFSFASIVFMLLGIALLPIAPIRNLVQQIMPKKKILRTIIAVVVFVFGCCIAPQTETTTEATAPISTEAIAETATEAATEIAAVTTAPVTEATTEASTEATTEPTTAPTTEPTTAPTTGPTIAPENSTFEIHFIDVGQADAALVLCDGKAMLIDGGNVEDSSLLYTYLKNQGIDHLDYVIGTHAHEDHIGGLAGALNYASVDVAYCPVTSYDTKAFGNFVKALDKHNVSITVPSTGDSFKLGSATCDILAVNVDNGDPNNTSIVLRIVYGDTSFLFTGDAEREVEQAILDRGAEISSTVLKVGHHGSESSTSYVWLREIMSKYAVISVGDDNSYGHPTEEVLSRLRDAEVKTYRTDIQGDIICVSDGKSVAFTVEKNVDADVFGNIGSNSTETTETTTEATTEPTTEPTEAATEDSGCDYVANKNTKKFHYDYCSSADDIKASNRWDYHGTRDELISMGYVPCKRCNP